MALIVEDGTGLANAESYVSVAGATAYCTDHGLTAWTGTDTAKEIALRNATQYIDTNYQFRHERISSAQSLEFPRNYWLWTDPEMTRLKAACCELAVKALTGSLVIDTEPSTTIKVKVGPIEKTMRPVDNSGQKSYRNVDMLLRDLVIGMGNKAIVRA